VNPSCFFSASVTTKIVRFGNHRRAQAAKNECDEGFVPEQDNAPPASNRCRRLAAAGVRRKASIVEFPKVPCFRIVKLARRSATRQAAQTKTQQERTEKTERRKFFWSLRFLSVPLSVPSVSSC
jgi:hypothetical protein